MCETMTHCSPRVSLNGLIARKDKAFIVTAIELLNINQHTHTTKYDFHYLEEETEGTSFQQSMLTDSACIDDIAVLLPLFAVRFDLLPTNQKTAGVATRASSQMLATACLARLAALTDQPDIFFKPLDLRSYNRTTQTTGSGFSTFFQFENRTFYFLVMFFCIGVSGQLAQTLMLHSDPQVRGNACLLAGNLIRSVSLNLIFTTPSSSSSTPSTASQLEQLLGSIQKLLSQEVCLNCSYKMSLDFINGLDMDHHGFHGDANIQHHCTYSTSFQS